MTETTIPYLEHPDLESIGRQIVMFQELEEALKEVIRLAFEESPERMSADVIDGNEAAIVLLA